MNGFVTVDGIKVPIEGEKNLLAVIRKAGIDIPTFCYHSHLSTYGACRLCLVEINGLEIDASCVVPPKDGMAVKTNTAKIRGMRRMNLELLLANHKQDCPTCDKSASCKLRDLAAKMGVRDIRFRHTRPEREKDEGSVALVRDPNKCILCGDCVRYCSEIQSVGAIDFANRGSDVVVTPAFGRSLGAVDCVNCGQCAAVCPTAAIVPKSHVDRVWKELDDKETTVVVQIAPAVRVALGEHFGLGAGETATGKITTALRMLGFDKVYDTSFGADLTVVEEATEFLERKKKGEKLPLFTSCCPAWVKFAEQLFPELLPNLSSCMSPQSMVGSLVREEEALKPDGKPDKLRVVSVMPCTAKKYEIDRPELTRDGRPLVDHVLTTTELAKMIQEAGIRFADLPLSAMDMPMGFHSGAGLIFGNSGGVSEAVARYVGPALSAARNQVLEFVQESNGVKVAVLDLGEAKLSVTVVQGLANAKRVAKDIREGKRATDIVEVMACPGGCIGGAGQPVSFDPEIHRKRTEGLRDQDLSMQLRTTRDNPFVDRYYLEVLKDSPGGHRVHELLHTRYRSKKRIQDTLIPLVRGTGVSKVAVKVCVGTSCFIRGSQALLASLLRKVEEEGLAELVDVNATFCSEKCNKGPTVQVGEDVLTQATLDGVMDLLRPRVTKLKAPA